MTDAAKRCKIEMTVKPGWMSRESAELLIRRISQGEISVPEIERTTELVKDAIERSKKMPSYFRNVTGTIRCQTDNKGKITRTLEFTNSATGDVIHEDILSPPLWLSKKSGSNYKDPTDRQPKTDPLTAGETLSGCLVHKIESEDPLTLLLAPEHAAFSDFITDLQTQLISKDPTGKARARFDIPRVIAARGQQNDGPSRTDQPTIRQPSSANLYPCQFTARSTHASKTQINDPTKPSVAFGVTSKDALKMCDDYFADEFNHGLEQPAESNISATLRFDHRNEMKDEIITRNAAATKPGKKSGQQHILYPTNIAWRNVSREMIPVPVKDAMFAYPEGVVVSMRVRLVPITETNIALYLADVLFLGLRNKTDGWKKPENSFLY